MPWKKATSPGSVSLSVHPLSPFFCRCNHSESSLDMTSQPGYGLSPKKHMCIGHFSVCASGCPHLHAARLLFFISCCNLCFRAWVCSLHIRHSMVYALFLWLAARSAGAYALLPRYFAHGPAQRWSPDFRTLQPRALQPWHTTFCAKTLKWLLISVGSKF